MTCARVRPVVDMLAASPGTRAFVMPLRFLLSRLLLAVLSLWGVSVLAFAILRILPGDPAILMAPVGSTAQDIERIRQEFGLSGSWWAQYGAFFLSLCRGTSGARSGFSRTRSA